MKRTCMVVACCLLLMEVLLKAQQPAAPPSPDASVLETKVRGAWQDFRNKDKQSFSSLLADSFREVEEDGKGFGDKQAILAMIDDFELKHYSLEKFVVKPIGTAGALVTYLARYEGTAGGQPIQASTAYGEIWIKQGGDWKLLYVQETNVK